MNVTFVPVHIALPGLATMLTLAATYCVTVIVIAFDIAGPPIAHGSDDVIKQVMLFPFANAVVENVALFVPTSVEPFFH